MLRQIGGVGAVLFISRPTISLDSDLRDADAAGGVRSAPARDLGGRPKSARSWSRSRKRSSLSSRAGREHSFSMRPPKTMSRRVRSRATQGKEKRKRWDRRRTPRRPCPGKDQWTIFASGGHADAVRWAATFPTGGWRSNMAAILLRTTPFSQRANPLAVVVGVFPETLHQTRDNTDFPRPLRKSEARLRLACPPPRLAQRRAAREGCWW